MEIIKLNLIPSGVNPTCHAKQYDKGRIIRFELFNGLTPYTLQSGDTVTLNLRKPDNTIIEASVTATQGNKYVDLVTTEQMCAVAGYNLGTFKIVNGETDIGTLNFIMAVERDVLADGIASQSVIEDLDELVQEAVGDNFYNKQQVDDLLSEKVSETELDNALAEKADKENINLSGTFSHNRKAGSTIGSKSFAEGNDTIASSPNSHAEGNNTAAIGNNAHAEGYYTASSGSASHSEGRNTYAVGDNSHAEGNGTRASHASQHVFGEFNVFDNSSAPATQRGNFVEIVGNGTSSSNRSNARTLDYDGNETLAGNLIYNGNKNLSNEINNRYTKDETNDKILNIMPTETASGSPASFSTSISIPLLDIEADIQGAETGSGTRTPSNPYTITSFNEVILTHYAENIANADILTFALGGYYYLGKLVITDKGDGSASVKFIGKYKKKTIDSSLLSSASWYEAYKQLGFSNVLNDAKYNSNEITYTCNKLVAISNTARGTHVGNYITLIGNGSGIAVSIPNCNSETDAKAFFNNDTLDFYYELANYIEIDLPDILSINAFDGVNNILANSGIVDVVYKKSIEDVSNATLEEVAEALEETNQYVAEKTKRELKIKTVHISSQQSPDASVKNLAFVCGKWINKVDTVPDYVGFLFWDTETDKFYYTDNLDKEPQFLFDWDGSLDGGAICRLYAPTITADGDIIFLKDHAMSNPIVYPHGDYAHPYVVDFGSSRKPYGWLMSSSVVHFDDGSFCFGDYAYHSQADEQNDVRRNIWHVSKPYNVVANWEIAHSFKHVYFTSPQSNEPDNEIGHIHAIMYDFYADDLYCTTGDIDRHCRMWISTDHGETWAAVPNAVGTTADTTVESVGQKWRMTNSVFTKDAIWWATDAAKPYHKLWKCTRDENGHVDFDTLTEVVDLETPALPNNYSQRTYITALVRDPNGLLILDRGEPRPDKLDIKFYDFNTGEVEIVRTFERAETDASELDTETRIGLCQQCTTIYQPQTMLGILTGGGKIIRPNNTSEFNNSKSNYVGTLLLTLN